jgi:hypothetical protein
MPDISYQGEFKTYVVKNKGLNIETKAYYKLVPAFRSTFHKGAFKAIGNASSSIAGLI